MSLNIEHEQYVHWLAFRQRLEKPHLEKIDGVLTPLMAYGKNVPNERALRHHLSWAGLYENEILPELINEPSFFHGTRRSRLRGIIDKGGLITHKEAFRGIDHPPGLFASADPITATFHADIRGPESMNRGKDEKSIADDPVILLRLNLSLIYSGEELKKYQRIAREEYARILNKGQGNIDGYVMGTGKFIFLLHAITAIMPQGVSGKVKEVPMQDFDNQIIKK